MSYEVGRRMFLQALASGAVGAVFAGELRGLKWVAGPHRYVLPPPGLTVVMSIQEIADVAAERLAVMLGWSGAQRQVQLALVDGAKLGDEVYGGRLTDHRCVEARLSGGDAVDVARFIDPMVALLATVVREKRFTACAPLPLPRVLESAIGTCPTAGVAVRALRDYSMRGACADDADDDLSVEWVRLLRFDMLMG